MVEDIHRPLRLCGFHLLPRLLALWEEANRRRRNKRLSQNEKPVQNGAAAGGDNGKWMRRQRFDSRVVDRDRRSGDARRLAQEGAFARIGLDQLDPRHAHDRQHQAGKPGAAAEIEQALPAHRQQRKKLRRIEEVAAPQIVDRAGGDQIDPPRPLPQQRCIGFEARQCFT